MLNKLEEKEYFLSFLCKTIQFTALVFPILFINIKIQKYRESEKITINRNIMLVLMQLLLGSGYLYILYLLLPTLNTSIQIDLAGIYLSGIFFGLQVNLFNNLQEIFKTII